MFFVLNYCKHCECNKLVDKVAFCYIEGANKCNNSKLFHREFIFNAFWFKNENVDSFFSSGIKYKKLIYTQNNFNINIFL